MRKQVYRLTMGLLMVVGGLGASVPGAVADTTLLTTAPKVQTLFFLRQDFRRCVFPLCGGVFAEPLNLSAAVCSDGVFREECYAAFVDWRRMKLDADSAAVLEREAQGGLAIVRGFFVEEDFGTFGDVGRLVITAAWRAATRNPPTEAFYQLNDTGVVCFASPCFNIKERLQNSGRRTLISHLDLSPAGATAAQEMKALDALAGPGLLASGKHVRFRDTVGLATELQTAQFYLRVPWRSVIKPR